MACKHSEARGLSREEQLEWCPDCGALYEDGEWSAPRRAAYIEPFGTGAAIQQEAPTEERITVLCGPILHWLR